MIRRLSFPSIVPGRSFLLGACLVPIALVGGCATESSLKVVNASSARRDIESRSTNESRSGECSPEHQKELSDALVHLTDVFTKPTEYAGFKRVGAQIVVARDAGTAVDLDTGLGGEYHVFAYGYSALNISAEDSDGNSFMTPSNRTHVAEILGGTPASLQLNGAKGDYIISVKGKGCALVATFKRVY